MSEGSHSSLLNPAPAQVSRIDFVGWVALRPFDSAQGTAPLRNRVSETQHIILKELGFATSESSARASFSHRFCRLGSPTTAFILPFDSAQEPRSRRAQEPRERNPTHYFKRVGFRSRLNPTYKIYPSTSLRAPHFTCEG
jgi:hypothetical protein